MSELHDIPPNLILFFTGMIMQNEQFSNAWHHVRSTLDSLYHDFNCGLAPLEEIQKREDEGMHKVWLLQAQWPIPDSRDSSPSISRRCYHYLVTFLLDMMIDFHVHKMAYLDPSPDLPDSTKNKAVDLFMSNWQRICPLMHPHSIL